MFLNNTTIRNEKSHENRKESDMEQVNLIEALMTFGLTRQEAVIYLALAANGTQTGYEIAKATGISRSNAYSGLSGLVEKGAAYVLEGKNRRYAAVESKEFCENKIRSLKERQCYIEEHMPREKEDAEGYLTITGDSHIIDKIYHMMEKTEYRMYLSISRERLDSFLEKIKELVQRNIKVVLITDETIEIAGAQIYLSEKKEDQIGLITDSAYVLTGELGKGRDSVCLYSGQKNFVKVFKDSLSNEIKLIELMKGDTL